MARLRNLGGKKKFCEVLELCYFECYQNSDGEEIELMFVLELYYSEYQHTKIKCIAITKPWLNLKRS